MYRPKTIPGAEENLAETYTRRMATLFGKDAQEVSKRIAPIFGSEPERAKISPIR